MGAVEPVTEHARHLFTPFHLFTSLYQIARKCTLKRRNLSPQGRQGPSLCECSCHAQNLHGRWSAPISSQWSASFQPAATLYRQRLHVASEWCHFQWLNLHDIQVKPWVETLASKKMELKHLCRLVELDWDNKSACFNPINESTAAAEPHIAPTQTECPTGYEVGKPCDQHILGVWLAHLAHPKCIELIVFDWCMRHFHLHRRSATLPRPAFCHIARSIDSRGFWSGVALHSWPAFRNISAKREGPFDGQVWFARAHLR